VDFVPLPLKLDVLKDLAPLWLPFLLDVSKRSKEPLADLVGQVTRFEVELALVWDGERPRALVGIRYRRRGDDVIGEIIWLTGKDMKRWRDLRPRLESYLRERGCSEIKPICRPGWRPFLEQAGYHVTHLVMEKKL